jgi:putative Holliday junction resolvase
MARIMAIDYGGKRVGIAVTDPMQIIATGLTTVHSKDLVTWMDDYFKKEEVETIVIGEPKQLDNTASESAEMINNFVTHVGRKFPNKKVARMDERFTSKMAVQTMVDSGLSKKKRRDKGLIDEISATIILQSYLEQNSAW